MKIRVRNTSVRRADGSVDNYSKIVDCFDSHAARWASDAADALRHRLDALRHRLDAQADRDKNTIDIPCEVVEPKRLAP